MPLELPDSLTDAARLVAQAIQPGPDGTGRHSADYDVWDVVYPFVG